MDTFEGLSLTCINTENGPVQWKLAIIVVVVVVVCHTDSVQDATLLETGSEYESYVDFGRELAVLHCVLRDCVGSSEVSANLLHWSTLEYMIKCCSSWYEFVHLIMSQVNQWQKLRGRVLMLTVSSAKQLSFWSMLSRWAS